MPVRRAKKAKTAAKREGIVNVSAGSKPDGFINVPVTRSTRYGLHLLKESMGVAGQAEVIEKLVAIGIAIHLASR